MRTALFAWMVLLPIALTGSAGAELETAEEIDACYRANFPDSTAVETISIQSKDRIGAVTTSRGELSWKKFEDGRSKVLLRFAKPSELRGAGLLLIEKASRNDMFMYLPALDRVKRVTKHMTSGSLFGTDFSYEEFERIQGIAGQSPSERADDDTVDGRASYVIVSRPTAEQESAYERIRVWIDKETCVALRTEFFERGDKPRKVMTSAFSKVTEAGGVFVPREILIRDHRDETETMLVVEEVEVGIDVPRKTFSERELVAGGR